MSTIQTYEWTGGQLADTKATSATLCPGRLRRVLVAIMATRVIAAAAMGQPGEIPGDDLSELSLEELMNEEITSAATPTETSARITPAAITAEQIQASGARSLFELLDIYVPNLQCMRQHWGPDHLGLQYQPNPNLTLRLDGYNLPGVFDRDLNKRNYLGGEGDYRSEAPAVATWLTYRF